MMAPQPRAANMAAHNRRLALHAAGNLDAEIAADEGVSKYTIRNWRKRHGLTDNARHYLSDDEQRRRLLMRAIGLGDHAMAKMLGIRKSTVCRWRRRAGEARQERRVSRNGDMGSCGIYSLDEPARGGGSKYDMLPDLSWSSWLEEAGATVW